MTITTSYRIFLMQLTAYIYHSQYMKSKNTRQMPTSKRYWHTRFLLICITFLGCLSTPKNKIDLSRKWISHSGQYEISNSILYIFPDFDEEGRKRNWSGRINDSTQLNILEVQDSFFIVEHHELLSSDTIPLVSTRVKNKNFIFCTLTTKELDINPITEEQAFDPITGEKKWRYLQTSFGLYNADPRYELATNEYQAPKFEIEGYAIGDSISLDSLSYFTELGNEFSLLKNPQIKIQIIGNQIARIRQTKIPFSDVEGVSSLVDKAFPTAKRDNSGGGLFPFQSWKIGSLSIRINNDFWSQDIGTYELNISDDYLVEFLEVKFADDKYYKNIQFVRDKINYSYKRAIELFESHQLDSVISLSTYTITLDSKFYLGYYLRAFAKKQLGNLHGAKSDLMSCLEINPYNYPALYDMALMAFNENNFITAKSYLERAINVDNKIPAAHELLGLVYFQLGENEKGCKELDYALNLGSEFARKNIKLFCGE